MAAQDSGASSSDDRARHALPPIRTFLGPELALPLPPRSAHSSGSSWDSVVLTGDILEAEPLRESSSGSESRRQMRSRGFTASSRGVTRGAEYDPRRTASPVPGYDPAPSSRWERFEDFRMDSYPGPSRDATAPPLRTRASTMSFFPAPRNSPAPSPPSARSLPPSPLAFGTRSPPSQGLPTAPASAPPASAFNVLRPSRSGGFITVPTTRSRSHSVLQPGASQATGAEGDSSRRHVCSVCRKRFNRPSSLKAHLSVHTGERPYVCTYPGCNRPFSVMSNMRRHLRTHTGGNHSDGEPEAEEPDREGREWTTTPEVHYEWAPTYRGP